VAIFFALVLCYGPAFAMSRMNRSKRAHASGCSSVFASFFRPTMKRPPPPKPSLKESGTNFNLARAKALNAYARLEQHLAMLFTSLLGSDTRKSYVVFSRLFVYRHRRQIFTDLLALSYGDTYAIFTKSLMKHLTKIEGERNKVVHWIAMTTWIGNQPGPRCTSTQTCLLAAE
jgi:hypothetical protein